MVSWHNSSWMLLCPYGLLTQFFMNAPLTPWFTDSILHECSSGPMVYWLNSSWMFLWPHGLLTQFFINAPLPQWFTYTIYQECFFAPMVSWLNSSWMLLWPNGLLAQFFMNAPLPQWGHEIALNDYCLKLPDNGFSIGFSLTHQFPTPHPLVTPPPPPHGLPSPQPSLLELQFSLNDATPLPPAPQPPNSSHSPCLTPSSTPCTPIRVEWYCTFSDFWKRALCCRSGIFFGFLQRSRSKIFNFNNSQGH